MTETLELSAGSMAENAAEAASLMKALAHEGRLMILCHLAAEQELSVSALEDRLGKRQAAVSQLLSRLRDDQLVQARREGKTVFYSLTEGPAKQVLGTLHDIYCA